MSEGFFAGITVSLKPFHGAETSSHLGDALKSKGYELAFLEVPGAVHNPESWRAQLADGLIYLIGKK
ncbi:MAG: hypothetical protein ABI646_04400 [Acidobacteriota bacterium]